MLPKWLPEVNLDGKLLQNVAEKRSKCAAIDPLFIQVGGACFVCCSACTGDIIKEFPIIKLEIFRDFYQILGSFFTNLGLSDALKGARDFFGNMSTLIALDWTYVFPTIPVGVMLAGMIAISILCLIATAALICATWGATPDEIREGHETVHWTKKSKWFRNLTWLTLNILISVYMPISTAALKVLTCHPQVKSIPHLKIPYFSICRLGSLTAKSLCILRLLQELYYVICGPMFKPTS